MSVDAYALDQFNQSMVYKSMIGEIFDYHQNVPEYIAGTAWQLGANPVFRQDVANYYANNQTLRQLIGNYTIT